MFGEIMGLVHVYTGDGKGKTTAAFGLAARALGRGMRVLIVQFLKGNGRPSGEAEFLRHSELAEVIYFENQRHPLLCRGEAVDLDALKGSIQAGFRLAVEKIMSGNYDLVVLDEVNNCAKEGWLDAADLTKLIREKPEDVELVLTGRGALPEVIELADYVTEMRLIKHPAQKGVKARKGVEF